MRRFTSDDYITLAFGLSILTATLIVATHLPVKKEPAPNLQKQLTYQSLQPEIK